MVVRARSWCRVDLAGGTLDLWPLGLLDEGARTINVAVDVPVVVTLAPRSAGYLVEQDGHRLEVASLAELEAHGEGQLVALTARFLGLPPVSVRLESGSPRGGGLGASSALVVALLAAGTELLGLPAEGPDRLAAVARDLEARLMGLPTGIQDHYPGLLGGALELAYPPGGHRVTRLGTDLAALGESLVVSYSGQSHFSAGANWQIVRRRLEGEPGTTTLLYGIGQVARELGRELSQGNLARVGRLMSDEWALRRQLAEGISTPRLEELLAIGLSAGAWGGKACGAGGGGSLAFLAPPKRRAGLVEALRSAGAQVLPARPTGRALEVERE
jgi:D-glycero-alpha-D-manno-heptose-7-phosphate kinase